MEMFRTLIIIFLGICLTSLVDLGTGIPQFKSNAIMADSVNYRIHQILPDNRIFMISLEENSYWYKDGRNVKALILNEKKQWNKAILFRNRLSKDLKLISINKLSRKKSETANLLISQLNDSKFLHLNTDSLNLTTGVLPDTIINGEVFQRTRIVNLTDGIDYRFEVLSEKNHRVISTYEPYKHFDSFPEYWQKGVFIKFLDQFKEIIDE